MYNKHIIIYNMHIVMCVYIYIYSSYAERK